MRRWWPALDLPALIAVILCVTMGYATRYSLNPDGVSYLDLAGFVREGDWSHFVQGYWSPLYPIFLALLGLVTGSHAPGWIAVAHYFDTAMVLATIAVICMMARRLNNLAFGLAGLSVLMLASGRIPRIEAVTPDLLLAFILVLLTSELLLHGGRRWRWVGVLFGLTYLAKSSSWPWLIAALLIALAGASDAAARRSVLRAATVCLGIMLLWIIPLSLKYGPTLGSSGRLNFHWYIENSNTRTPDEHTGWHKQYLEVPIDSATKMGVATFENAGWSYQPWGDPTAWDAGLIGGYPDRGVRLSWLARALREFDPLLRVWTVSVTLAVLLPLFMVRRRRGMFRRLVREERSAAYVILLGVLGIGQFIAVHAEPRLIAPFVLMGGLGIIVWLTRIPPGEQTGRLGSRAQLLLATVPGSLWALVLSQNFVMRELFFSTDDLTRQNANIENARHFAPQSPEHPTIVLIGDAGPLMSDVWRVGGRVVAQVFRPAMSVIEQWSDERKLAMVAQLRRYGADLIWVVLPDGSLATLPGKE